jgi:hypothetical protein
MYSIPRASKSNRFRQNSLSNVILLFLSLLISLVIVEVGLRLYGIVPDRHRLFAYEFDDEIGWQPRKNFRCFHSTPNYAHFNYYNAEGLPTDAGSFGSSYDHDKPAIALVGDSFVESYYVPYEKSFPFLLDQAITSHQVVNLGVSGYSPEQYLLRSRRELPKYNVSHVIVVLFAHNDVNYVDKTLYLGYAKPVFGDDLSQPSNTPLPMLGGQAESGSLVQRFGRRTAVYTVLRPFYKTYIDAPDEYQIPDELTLDEDKFAKAMRIIAEIRNVVPMADFHVAYMPLYQEVVNGDAFIHNIETFRRNCNLLGLSCHVSRFDKLDPDELLRQYIDPLRGEGHISIEGSARYAKFLEEILALN